MLLKKNHKTSKFQYSSRVSQGALLEERESPAAWSAANDL